MRIPKATWLSCAGIVFLAGLISNSSDLIFASAVVVSVGLGSEAVAALRSRRQPEPRQGVVKLHDLEQRLLLTENVLASATQQLANLKDDREPDSRVRPVD